MEVAFGRGHGITGLQAGHFGAANELDAARLGGAQVPQVEFEGLAVGMFQALRQRGADFDMIGRAVAWVRDGERDGRHVAHQDFFRRGRLDQKPRLAHANARRG